ncbi:MFS transporter [Fontibacillus sp. BL9]|uniref:MFS transporter n=1 Tax=Fontibacillus sp. BL9 TaxID=3389971 RepID=UPI00397DD276
MPGNDNEIQRSAYRMLKVFNFVLYGALAIFGTYFALYLKNLGVSNIAIGAILAGGPVVSLIANPFWAYWADRLRNNRRILIITLALALVAMQFVFLSRSEPFIFGTLLAFFVFQSPLYTQSNSLILNSIQGTGLKFGAFRLWGSLGWAISAAAFGPLIGKLGIDRLWIVFDVMILLALIFAFLLPTGGESERKEVFSNSGYRQVFLNRPFMLLVLIGILVSVPNSINNTFVGIYISDLGGSESVVGWSIFATAILEAPVFLLLDRFLKPAPQKMILWMSLVSVLYSVRWLLMSSVETAAGIIWIQLMHCVTFGAYYYIGTQLTSRLVPDSFRSTGQAVYGLTWGGVSGIIAGLTGGWMFEHLGPVALYRISALITMAGVFGFLFMLRLTRKSFGEVPTESPAGTIGK